MDATLALIEEQRTAFDSLLAKLFDLNADGSLRADGSSLTALSWDPSHDAVLLRGSPGWNAEAIVSNDRTSGDAPPEQRGLAAVGMQGSARYLALASNPFRTRCPCKSWRTSSKP